VRLTFFTELQNELLSMRASESGEGLAGKLNHEIAMITGKAGREGDSGSIAVTQRILQKRIDFLRDYGHAISRAVFQIAEAEGVSLDKAAFDEITALIDRHIRPEANHVFRQLCVRYNSMGDKANLDRWERELDETVRRAAISNPYKDWREVLHRERARLAQQAPRGGGSQEGPESENVASLQPDGPDDEPSTPTEFSPSELAAHLRMSLQTLGKYVDLAGVPRRRKGGRPQHRYSADDAKSVANSIVACDSVLPRHRDAALGLLRMLRNKELT